MEIILYLLAISNIVFILYLMYRTNLESKYEAATRELKSMERELKFYKSSNESYNKTINFYISSVKEMKEKAGYDQGVSFSMVVDDLIERANASGLRPWDERARPFN